MCFGPIATTLKGIEYCYLHTAPTVTPKLELKDEVILQPNPKTQMKAKGKTSLMRLVNSSVHELIFIFFMFSLLISVFLSLLGVSQGIS